MKGVYWRPQKMPAATTLWIGIVAIAALACVELLPRLTTPNYASQKLAAIQLAERCRGEIGALRQAKNLPINKQFDPHRTGLIGTAMSSITSKPADIRAKQLSLHPQFPAAVVQMLKDAGVEQGDTVAVGWTGSFPALNLALAAAMETLELRPLIVGSVMASQYGANESDLVWLDMEQALAEANLINFRTGVATVGGSADCGKGMTQQSLADVRAAMERNGVKQLSASLLSESIDRRMRWLESRTAAEPIAAYINVGGGVASCGGDKGVFGPGLNAPGPEPVVDCVMQRFYEGGTPVIQLARAKDLAAQFGLSTSPDSWQSTQVAMRSSATPNRIVALVTLVLLWSLLQAFILKDTGYQLMRDALRLIRNRPSLRVVGQEDGPQLMA